MQTPSTTTVILLPQAARDRLAALLIEHTDTLIAKCKIPPARMELLFNAETGHLTVEELGELCDLLPNGVVIETLRQKGRSFTL